jgi:hypothetical protein
MFKLVPCCESGELSGSKSQFVGPLGRGENGRRTRKRSVHSDKLNLAVRGRFFPIGHN